MVGGIRWDASYRSAPASRNWPSTGARHLQAAGGAASGRWEVAGASVVGLVKSVERRRAARSGPGGTGTPGIASRSRRLRREPGGLPGTVCQGEQRVAAWGSLLGERERERERESRAGLRPSPVRWPIALGGAGASRFTAMPLPLSYRAPSRGLVPCFPVVLPWPVLVG